MIVIKTTPPILCCLQTITAQLHAARSKETIRRVRFAASSRQPAGLSLPYSYCQYRNILARAVDCRRASLS